MVENIVDIGAGVGDYLIGRANREPNKQFLILEPNKSCIPKTRLPKNLKWISQGITTRGLNLSDNSQDEIHANRILPDLREDGGDKFVQLLVSESLRILRAGSQQKARLYIREPRYSVEMLEPTLRSLNVKYRIESIPVEEALEISESLNETAQEFQAGDATMEPLLVIIEK